MWRPWASGRSAGWGWGQQVLQQCKGAKMLHKYGTVKLLFICAVLNWFANITSKWWIWKNNVNGRTRRWIEQKIIEKSLKTDNKFTRCNNLARAVCCLGALIVNVVVAQFLVFAFVACCLPPIAIYANLKRFTAWIAYSKQLLNGKCMWHGGP